MIKKCLICGKEFYVKPCNQHRSKYCSRKCLGINNGRTQGFSKGHKGFLTKKHYLKIAEKLRNKPNAGWFTTERIKNRKCSEKTREKIRQSKLGEKNPMWNDGSSAKLYGIEFNNKLKEQIRKRDTYLCRECGIIQECLPRKLSVHHIDYNKENNDIYNLISLCGICHSKTQKDRKYWTKYFQKLFIQINRRH